MARSRWRKKHGSLQLRSGFEKKVAAYLDEHKIKYEYETQIIEYVQPEKRHKYKPDYILPNGVIIEVKGRFTAEDRKKMSLVIEQNPDKDIRLLFMVNNKLSKASKTTYVDWCTKRNIKCHVSSKGEVPSDWFKNDGE